MLVIKLFIEFELSGKDKEEIDLMEDFLKQLILDIRVEIYNNIVPAKLQAKESDLLKVPWIDWIKKPKNLDVNAIAELIISRIGYRVRINQSYIIMVNPKAKLPNSYTPISKVARFLDKGNDVTPCTTFITDVFNEYRKNINKYWDAYISIKLDRPKVRTKIIIT